MTNGIQFGMSCCLTGTLILGRKYLLSYSEYLKKVNPEKGILGCERLEMLSSLSLSLSLIPIYSPLGQSSF